MDHSYSTERVKHQSKDHSYFHLAKKTPHVVVVKGKTLTDKAIEKYTPLISRDHTYPRGNYMQGRSVPEAQRAEILTDSPDPVDLCIPNEKSTEASKGHKACSVKHRPPLPTGKSCSLTDLAWTAARDTASGSPPGGGPAPPQDLCTVSSGKGPLQDHNYRTPPPRQPWSHGVQTTWSSEILPDHDYRRSVPPFPAIRRRTLSESNGSLLKKKTGSGAESKRPRDESCSKSDPALHNTPHHQRQPRQQQPSLDRPVEPQQRQQQKRKKGSTAAASASGAPPTELDENSCASRRLVGKDPGHLVKSQSCDRGLAGSPGRSPCGGVSALNYTVLSAPDVTHENAWTLAHVRVDADDSQALLDHSYIQPQFRNLSLTPCSSFLSDHTYDIGVDLF